MAKTNKCPMERDPKSTFIEQNIDLPEEVNCYLKTMYTTIGLLSDQESKQSLTNLITVYQVAKRIEEVLRPFYCGNPMDMSLEELEQTFTPERLEEFKKYMSNKVKELDPEEHLSKH